MPVTSAPQVLSLGSAKTTPAVPGAKGQRVHPHIAHILAHFDRLKGGHMTVQDPGEVFLGRIEGHFIWELICFRMSGHPTPLLGCMRFRRHDFPGKVHARESLASYLSDPPNPSGDAGLGAPMGALPVLLPRTTESVGGFLRNMAAGIVPQAAYLDPTIIELAWDFRTYNPYGLENLRQSARPLRDRLMRTSRGHVLRGMSHEVIEPDRGEQRFVAIKDPVQLTQKGKISLPSLAVNRTFLAMSADITDQTTRLAAANWAPFSASAAVKRHMLLG